MSAALLRILLDSSLRILPATLGAIIMLRVFNNRSSELPHRIWTIIVCSMLSMPLLTFGLPPLPVTLRLPQQSAATAKVTHVSETVIRRTLPASATFEVPFEQVAPGTGSAAGAASRFTWASLASGVYVAGLIVFVTRFCLGWLGTRTLLRHSRRVEIAKVGKAYESDQIAAPVTIGIFAPRIILPAIWRTWPEIDLHAILVHETEHRRRHHLLTSLFSHINCCLFWFHPLAWWLDRKLAVCAEETCDDAAIRSIDSPQRYAGILVDMAKAVHLRGTRLSWTAVGMKGTGALAKRVDRIIAGRISGPPSFTRTISATLACIVIILVFAACRGESLPTFAEEQQALERVQSRELAHQAHVDLIQLAIDNAAKLTPPQAAELEAQLAKDPDNVHVRLELLAFYLYRAQAAGMDARAIIRNRREHILWFIRSRPADDLAASDLIFINTQSADSFADPEGYVEGKKAWLEQIKMHPSAAVLGNAAYFMQVTDKEQSETFLLHAQQLRPDGRWTDRLAQLYASMILGATAINAADNDFAGLLPISTNPADQRGPLAEEARRKLDETKDFTLLFNVGRILLGVRNIPLDFDPVPLGERYLKRSEALASSSDQTARIRVELSRLHTRNRQARIQALPKERRYEAALALNDRDRFELLWDLALFNYGYGNSFDADHRGEALDEWHKAAMYAAALVSVAEKFRKDPEYGNAIFNANMMLAYVESRNGNTRGTLRYVHEALKAPTADKGGDYPWLWSRVSRFLVQQGCQNDVIAFLERFAQIDPIKRDDLLAAAAQLRNGQIPDWQRLS